MDEIEVLEAARRDLRLSLADLWWRYFSLGGMMTALEMEAVLHRALIPTLVDRDLLAVALNERFREVGCDHPIPYSDDADQL
jgi:hypothetical protein